MSEWPHPFPTYVDECFPVTNKIIQIREFTPAAWAKAKAKEKVFALAA
jgi:hypothetical protein